MSFYINSALSAPCPTAGIYNPYNSGGFASQYFSNINYTYLNLWIDLQTFPQSGISSYADSISVAYNIFWDGSPASATAPSAYYGQTTGIIKLFPKRYVSNWGAAYSGVTAYVNNSYSGLTNYNSVNTNYAPYGRQYWCYNNVFSSTYSTATQYQARLFGGASYALIQFPNPVGTGNYSASTSLEVLDSTLVQTNTNSSANSGLKVYINYGS